MSESGTSARWISWRNYFLYDLFHILKAVPLKRESMPIRLPRQIIEQSAVPVFIACFFLCGCAGSSQHPSSLTEPYELYGSNVDRTIVSPVLQSDVPPVYQSTTSRAGLSGRVLVKALVSKSGYVQQVRLLESSADVFSNAAIAVVRRYVYSPALKDGEPVDVWIAVEVRFGQ
jgi:TonB family protein